MKKIAIIGSGISGLTCAHLLADKHDVHVFEADKRIGGHTNTLEVEVPSGKYAVDTGFIVFNDRNYPNFIKLMDKLKIPSQPSEMSFSVRVERNDLEYNGSNLNTLFCQRRNLVNPSFYRMIWDIMRFNKQATQYYYDNIDLREEGKTLEEYLLENQYSVEFTETYIMPMAAAIWSCNRQEIKNFPLNFFVRFFHHHGLLTIDNRPQWRVLNGGSKSYLPALTANFTEKIHLNSPVVSVQRMDHGIGLIVLENGSKSHLFFDEVIFASHADQTLEILTDSSPLEKEIMSGFSYRPNDVILHTDTSILPRATLGHASWNYYLPEQMKDRVAVTYHMNILQNIKSPETFLVSLNMDQYIDPKKVIRKILYSHPIYTIEAMRSQERWEEISGKNHVHFCGAYWGNGFHEDGVKSALKVTSHFGVDL